MPDHTTRPRNKKFTQEQENEICQRYNTPLPNGDMPTALELAVEFGCSDYIIRSIVKHNGLEVRQNRGRQAARMFDAITEIAICEYYWTKLPTGYYPSYKEAGAHFGCSGSMVQQLLKRHDYESRTQAETRDKRPCKPINPPIGIAPLCKCGCGIHTEWNSSHKKWFLYVSDHYRPKKLYHDAEWLRREYIDNVRSVAEIAEQFGVHTSVVIKSMKKHGIGRRTTKDALILRGSSVGAKNPAWKGGVAKWDYAPDWKRLCKQIKDRDKWTCQLCGLCRSHWGHRLHVHHIDEDKTNNDPRNLISLCWKCHGPIHGKEEKRAMLVEIAMRNTDSQSTDHVVLSLR